MADTPVTDIAKLSKTTQDTIAANAKSQGITPQEYLTSRGGVYASGYYGDTPEFRRLSDAEYATAAKKGSGAINAAMAAKLREAYIADPSLIEDPRLRLSYQNGRITIDDVLNGVNPGSAPVASKQLEQIGAMADGTPFYGWDSTGKPVTNSSGTVYSITSSSDAIGKFSTGANPLFSSSSSTSSTGLKSDAQIAADTAAATAKGERQSAYDLLYSEFSKYGLESLVTPLKGLITSGASPSEFTIKLRETPEYQQRFAGNAQRVANGLTAIDEATYLAKEDAYQNLMRNYGLPDTYWKKGALGTQEGFTKLIANDVSAVELENRLQTAQQRVLNSNPEVAYTLKAFYPDITNGDILAYALDPKNALDTINRKVTAAEIGGAALSQGLTTSLGGAEGLAAYGITKAQAQQGYQNVAGMVPRGSQLADIYGQQPYNQGTAEAEVFGTAGAADAKKRREKLISLESASFGGSSGVGALGRDKNIYGAAFGQTGQY